jgi:hypothetical protein
MHRLAIRYLAALAAAVPVMLVAAPAGAVKAGPELTVASGSATEGSPVIVRIKADCPYRACKFRIRPASLTAVAGDDFVLTSRSRTLKKGKDFDYKPSFATVDDTICENTEQFSISVTASYSGEDDQEVAKAKSTIIDDDCMRPVVTPTPPPPPTPTPTPTFTTAPPTPSPSPTATASTYPPPDTGSPTFYTSGLQDGVMQTCSTPAWSGTYTAPYGFYNGGCITEYLQCPPYAQLCRVAAESGIVIERPQYGHTVTLNSRIRVYVPGPTEYYHHDVSCAGTGSCSTQDSYTIRGGEFATSQCNGVRQAAAEPNRSTVHCTLTVQKTY